MSAPIGGSFRLDDKHPMGASHHQKVIVIDDAVAFVSGFDLTRMRWDTSAHDAVNPLRVDSSGKRYGPFHDVGAVVAGACARALGELARDRWQRATDRVPRHTGRASDCDVWPPMQDRLDNGSAYDVGTMPFLPTLTRSDASEPSGCRMT